MRRPDWALTLALLLAATGTAAGQATAPAARTAGTGPEWDSRGFLALSGGVRLGTVTFDETTRQTIGGEDFVWTADYEVQPGLAFDVSGGARVWRRLVAAVSFTRTTDSQPAIITGSVPHPFFFEQPRDISGESEDLSHVEQAIHVSAMWVAPAGRHLEVSVFGGPSFVDVRRDLIADVRYTEEYPYDEATFAAATAEEVKERAIGFHAGADVTWLFTPTAGLGVTGRYTRAPIELDTPAGNTVDFDAGGFQIVAGLRLRFGGAPSRTAATPIAAPAPDDNPRPVPGSRPLIAQFPEGTVIQTTPVFLRPDESRTPLRQLPENMRVRILETEGDWLRVEFNDERLGRRVGYVRRTAVRVDPGGH